METVTWNETNPPSLVFSSEQASNQEMQVRKLVAMGFSAFRVSFAPACSTLGQFMTSYNSTRLERSIRIAEHFGLWVIVDYHGYDDAASSGGLACWLGFWKTVVQDFTKRYERIVWEPLNEPTGFGGSNVSGLSNVYQLWINQTRLLADTHWIVVQNLCSYGCTFSVSHYAEGYPNVTDAVGRVFISLHTYMDYGAYSASWDNATAELVAHQFYESMIAGAQNTGWPMLNTEGGPGRVEKTVNGADVTCPDLVLTGSAGYCSTNFHFIQTLTSLLDSHTPKRFGWLWWPMGSWTDTPGANVYGALAFTGWGSFLLYTRATISVSSLRSTVKIG